MNKLIITAMLAMMCGGVSAQEVELDTTSVNAKLLTAEGNRYCIGDAVSEQQCKISQGG